MRKPHHNYGFLTDFNNTVSNAESLTDYGKTKYGVTEVAYLDMRD
jgi:hypothetical protein